MGKITSAAKWQEYYITDSYKGFRKCREHNYKLIGVTHLTFTNGEKEVFASGTFKEEALANIFKRIDNYIKKSLITVN